MDSQPLKPNPAGIALRRAKVAEMYLRGVTQVLIAERLNVTQPTISGDLKALRKEWLASAVRDFDEAKAHEVAKCDEVEKAAWMAWRRSCRPRKKTRTIDTTSGDKEVSGTIEDVENQCGDPRFLNVVLDCVKKRCLILGLDAPTKIVTDLSLSDQTQLEEAERRLGLSPGGPRFALPTANQNN